MRFIRLLSIGVAFIIFTVETWAQDEPTPVKVELTAPQVSVPLHWARGTPVVDVKINGQGPFRFFLDTGAQGSVLGLDLANELKLPVLGESQVRSPGGKGIPSKTVRLDRLEIGAAILSKATAQAFDRSFLSRGPESPRGVLSAKSFPGYLLTLYYPKERLLIRPGELPAPDGKTIFAYDPKLPLPELPVNVAGTEITLHMDSGAPSGITLPLELAEKLPLESRPVEVGRGRRVDQEVIILGAKLKGDVKVGRFVLHNPDLRFQNIPGAKGNIGGEFLRKFAVTLDSRNSRIFLEEAPDVKTQAEPRPRRYGIRLVDLARTPLEVADVDRDSPAAKAGLQKADIILKMNDRALQDMGAEQRMTALTGSTLKLQVQRGTKKIELTMSLEGIQ